MAFTRLPIELNAQIAGLLESDSDLAAFARTCRETHNAVTSDSSPVWRDLFVKRFDLVPNVSNNALRRAYQHRRKVLHRGASFCQGKGKSNSKAERECLQVLRDLLLESYASGVPQYDNSGVVVSRNLEAIVRFAYAFDIIQAVTISPWPISAQSHPRAYHLMMIQVMLSFLQFDLGIKSQIIGFPDSQKAMYATVEKAPIFVGPNKDEVNLQWVANAVNFFKFHFTCENQGTIYHYYADLPLKERVKAWNKPLSHGTRLLGKKWKGIYSYLEHVQVADLRNDKDEGAEDIFNCLEDTDVPFQSLNLAFSKTESKKNWPRVFEHHLQSISGPYGKPTTTHTKSHPMTASRTRAQHRAAPAHTSSLRTSSQAQDGTNRKSLPFHFHGSGMDSDMFYASGWLNPLPIQHGFPGMQRMTMMKYFVDVDEEDGAAELEADPFGMKGVAALNESIIDERSLWAYEGVVLPGGELIVGRWWCPEPLDDPEVPGDNEGEVDMYSGPFMFWCVDDESSKAE